MLDLSDVTFLGSAGLAVLVAAKDAADARGHTLRLVCGSRIVTRALEATGLLTLFDVADGVPQALGPVPDGPGEPQPSGDRRVAPRCSA